MNSCGFQCEKEAGMGEEEIQLRGIISWPHTTAQLWLGFHKCVYVPSVQMEDYERMWMAELAQEP